MGFWGFWFTLWGTHPIHWEIILSTETIIKNVVVSNGAADVDLKVPLSVCGSRLEMQRYLKSIFILILL